MKQKENRHEEAHTSIINFKVNQDDSHNLLALREPHSVHTQLRLTTRTLHISPQRRGPNPSRLTAPCSRCCLYSTYRTRCTFTLCATFVPTANNRYKKENSRLSVRFFFLSFQTKTIYHIATQLHIGCLH